MRVAFSYLATLQREGNKRHDVVDRSKESAMSKAGVKHKSAVRAFGEWILHEVQDLALLTAYFYVAFVVIIFYKATVLHSYGIRYVVFGFAIAKAVLIAKFMLIGRKIKMGEVRANSPLIKPIVLKLAGFMAILLVLTGIEQVMTTLIHHQSLTSLLQAFRGSELGQTLAEVLILLLVLIPFVAFTVFGEALGEGTLRDLLFKGGKLKYESGANRTDE
jgi:hypothetical protein